MKNLIYFILLSIFSTSIFANSFVITGAERGSSQLLVFTSSDTVHFTECTNDTSDCEDIGSMKLNYLKQVISEHEKHGSSATFLSLAIIGNAIGLIDIDTTNTAIMIGIGCYVLADSALYLISRYLDPYRRDLKRVYNNCNGNSVSNFTIEGYADFVEKLKRDYLIR